MKFLVKTSSKSVASCYTFRSELIFSIINGKLFKPNEGGGITRPRRGGLDINNQVKHLNVTCMTEAHQVSHR